MKNLKILFLLILVSSCGHKVEIKDNEWCGDLGEYGATCNRMLSDRQRELTKEEWDLERPGMICGKPEAFANLKEVIQKLCVKNKKCEYEKIKQATRFLQELNDEFDNYKASKIYTQE